MPRVLLIVLGLLSFAVALVPLISITVSAGAVWTSDLLANLHSPRGLAALEVAGAVTVLAVPLAFLLAAILIRASFWLRVVALGGCVILLMQPDTGIVALPTHLPANQEDAYGFLVAVSRAFAAGLLLLSAGVSRIPANLLVAARAAGAGPIQAWRHAILTPLAWPLLGAIVAAFMIGIAAGPVQSPLIPEFAVLRVWTVAPALLVAIASLAVLGALLRRRPA